MKRGGFGVFTIIDERTRNEMLSEALGMYADAVESDVRTSDGQEVRGGSPARRFRSAPGGPVQNAFHRASWALDFLRELTCPPLRPTGGLGTYSYYARSGDFLSIHRDIVTCDVAVITCLHDGPALPAEAGTLCLYPERASEPLSAILATPERAAVQVRVRTGETIVMFGGIVPHAVLPVARAQVRIVSVSCYRAL